MYLFWFRGSIIKVNVRISLFENIALLVGGSLLDTPFPMEMLDRFKFLSLMTKCKTISYDRNCYLPYRTYV